MDRFLVAVLLTAAAVGVGVSTANLPFYSPVYTALSWFAGLAALAAGGFALIARRWRLAAAIPFVAGAALMMYAAFGLATHVILASARLDTPMHVMLGVAIGYLGISVLLVAIARKLLH